MGTVIQFPDERRGTWRGAAAAAHAEPASVVILPVVRIERHIEEPPGGLDSGTSGGTGGRRRGRRS